MAIDGRLYLNLADAIQGALEDPNDAHQPSYERSIERDAHALIDPLADQCAYV